MQTPTDSALGPLADFCGAYVDNAFSETQETWIDLKTERRPNARKASSSQRTRSPTRTAARGQRARAASWWAQTRFHLPFMYTCGCEPFFDEHTLIVLPFVDRRRSAR